MISVKNVAKRFLMCGIFMAMLVACGDDSSSTKPSDDIESEISNSSIDSSDSIASSNDSTSKSKSSSSEKILIKSCSSTQKSSSSQASSSSQKRSSSSLSLSSSVVKSSSSYEYYENINSSFSYGEYTDLRDGQIYRTANIGKTKWFAQNLNFATENSECPRNDSIGCKIQGRLYTWNEAQVVCPDGWHLPTRGEYEEMMHIAHSFDNERFDLNKIGFSPTLAGYKYEKKFEKNNLAAYVWSASDTTFEEKDYGLLFCFERNYGFDTQRKHNHCYRDYYWDDKELFKTAVRCINDTAQFYGFSGEYGKVVDERDGEEYRTVVIGTQTWMADDLRYKTSPDSNGIYLYTSDQYRSVDSLCPEEWHVPTEYEWEKLIDYVNTFDEFPEAVKTVDVWMLYFFGSNKTGLDIKPNDALGSYAGFWVYWPPNGRDHIRPQSIIIKRWNWDYYGDGYVYSYGYATERIRCVRNSK